MKTSDIELTASPSLRQKRNGTSHFGVAELISWVASKAGVSTRKKKSKFKMNLPVPPAPRPDTKTQVSQTVDDVLRLLRSDGARRVLVYGDAAFYQDFAARAAGMDAVWVSTDIIGDRPAGARGLSGALVRDCDAIVTGGTDVGTRFRYSLRLAHTHAPATPVHWVAQNWEFCAGTAAIPLEIDDVDALAFNHFEEFFGIKDPLQFRFEIIAEGEIRRSYLVLGPSQSVNLNLRSLMPERKGAICMKVFVAHPFLTRGRHYRFRVCGDVFWKDSFTIIHGSHQFFKSPDKIQPFRLIDSVIRNGEVIMTVPNYDLDMGENDEVVIGTGSEKSVQKRSRARPVEEVHFRREGNEPRNRRYFAASYAGYGTSFWYALDRDFSGKPGKAGSIAANHLCRVGVDNRDDILFTAEERTIVEAAVAAGFMIHPCCLPVTHGQGGLDFGFNFDASNPPFEDYWLRYYDADGGFIGEQRYHKGFIGPVYTAEILAQWSNPRKAEAAMLLVCPDHLKIGLAPQRLVTTADMAVMQLETGDQDFTEFQASWRNVGADIPTLPHWLHPSIGIMGRTNLVGRVRTRGGFRTGVFVGNASGNLNYEMPARTEIITINHAGERLVHRLTLPPFGAKIVWLDDVLPGLREHVGDTGIAALQVKSNDADLTAHVLGTSPGGAVGLQHLWGY